VKTGSLTRIRGLEHRVDGDTGPSHGQASEEGKIVKLFRDLHGNLVAGARVAGFMPVDRWQFRPGPDQSVLLVILLSLAGVFLSFAITKPDRIFNSFGLATIGVTSLALLLACYAVARLHRRSYEFGTILAAAASALTIIYLFAGVVLQVLWAAGPYLTGENLLGLQIAIAAIALVAVTRSVHMVFGGSLVRAGALAAPMLVLILSYNVVPKEALWISIAEEPETAETAIDFDPDVESIYYRQAALLDAAAGALAPHREDATDLYFVGFAGHAHQDVFMKEVRAVRGLFDKRFDTKHRSLLLINNPATIETAPLANRHNLTVALQQVAARMDTEQDILFLFLTSHGSSYLLSTKFYPLGLNDLTADDLKAALTKSGIKWRVVVVSACYSGSFINTLRDANTLVLTASSATANSFGCSDLADWTYFGKAYFDEALRQTYSFSDAFDTAVKSIAAREESEQLKASEPQIHIGARIRPLLQQLSDRLSGYDDGQIAELP
jgi:hypothetical protein